MFKRNLILGYICLVGIPLLAMIAILDAGHGLRAAAVVGGTWDVQADFQGLASSPCAAPLLAAKRPALRISQSGRYLALSLDRLQGPGRVDDGIVTAGALRTAGGDFCGSQDHPVILRANLERSAGQAFLNGTITVDGCPSCAAVAFRATSLNPSAKAGR
ncbi:MAG TPA: hypothetical protein VFA33_10980 [Bryobacteraceae bacterium]|nr:hypothetical protein [Bryobacteraceae bacterium]